MLEEAVGIIAELFAGGQVTRRGKHYTVQTALLYSRPAGSKPVQGGAKGCWAPDAAPPQAGGLVTVTLPGEIDLISVGEVRDALALALESGAAVVIADAAVTTYCDCAGVRALVVAHRRAAASLATCRKPDDLLHHTHPGVVAPVPVGLTEEKRLPVARTPPRAPPPDGEGLGIQSRPHPFGNN